MFKLQIQHPTNTAQCHNSFEGSAGYFCIKMTPYFAAYRAKSGRYCPIHLSLLPTNSLTVLLQHGACLSLSSWRYFTCVCTRFVIVSVNYCKHTNVFVENWINWYCTEIAKVRNICWKSVVWQVCVCRLTTNDWTLLLGFRVQCHNCDSSSSRCFKTS